ncbi:uncharacterized protein BDR25DRAFT_344129 [Lindgomyces ingoldianus]|uniref:Uncharacterized protein n=1 Tax=Lindgomyces ingoldianus TaxID=673940 RepID=A0ACB6QPI4_9PLEO|nr:uncharacterized protein BDR25DRAFT_344129 [Lindgomyces ingoldianus]KAF2468913.1 hypothetical protein BDR25DRAFT_344129 [Lindgomyces ingoldianus]
MPRKRSRNTTRQTKLNFSPVPASSPGAAHLPIQDRDRVTAQTYDGFPSKKRKVAYGRTQFTRPIIDSEDEPEPSFGLPTPKKSSQALGRDKSYKRDAERGMRLGMPVATQLHGMFGTSDDEQLVSSSSSSETSEDEPAPIKPTPKKRTKDRQLKAAKSTSLQKSGYEGDRKSSRLRQSSHKQNQIPLREPESDLQSASKRARSVKNDKTAANLQRSNETDSVLGRLSSPEVVNMKNESSDSEVMPDTTPARRTCRPTIRRQRGSLFEVPDEAVEQEESEDDDVPLSMHTRRGARYRLTPEDEESEDEIRTPGRRLIRKKIQHDVSDGDSDEEEPTPARGHSHRKDQQRVRKEQEDLEEDLEFLRSSPPPDNGRLRNRSSRPMNARQKALEALKRRRAGPRSELSPSVPSARKGAFVRSDLEDDLEVIGGDEEEEENGDGEVDEDEDFSTDDVHPYNCRVDTLDMFQENVDDADFVVDEDENGDDFLGAPAELSGIPLAFTSMNSKKPRELFKYAIEWMVQKKINPGFSSDDEIYELTFRKLNDEVNGLVNSKFSSSVWTPDFTRALRSRPDITINEISKLERDVTSPHCQACNRTKHPASYNISFSGKPYNKDTLEPLYEDDDDDKDSTSDSDEEDSDSDSISLDSAGNKKEYNANGEVLPPASTVFTLGSTCKANAQVAHTLRHWRYHLYTWVIDYLVTQGHQTPEKLLKRDKWSQRKREKYANKIVDRMEKDGQIRKLHSLYRDQIDFALETKNDYNRGWGRRG